jgi:hypothetical protein
MPGGCRRASSGRPCHLLSRGDANLAQPSTPPGLRGSRDRASAGTGSTLRRRTAESRLPRNSGLASIWSGDLLAKFDGSPDSIGDPGSVCPAFTKARYSTRSGPTTGGRMTRLVSRMANLRCGQPPRRETCSSVDALPSEIVGWGSQRNDALASVTDLGFVGALINGTTNGHTARLSWSRSFGRRVTRHGIPVWRRPWRTWLWASRRRTRGG